MQRGADGLDRLHTSRRFRKGLLPVGAGADAATRGNWHRLWDPRKLSWWIAVLFMLGSLLFTGAAALACFVPAVSTAAVNWTYFCGSIFFTLASYLQWLESINGDVACAGSGRAWRWFAWLPRNLGYLASLVQLVGTLLFNFNTGDALISGLDWYEADLLVWTPGLLGCICFLAASLIAYFEITEGRITWEPRHLSWWIAVINLAGSVFFQVAVCYSFEGAGPADDGAVWWANFHTLIGAACFLVGSYLLIPEAFDETGSRT